MAIEPISDSAMACYTESGIYVFSLGQSAEEARLTRTESPVGLVAEWGVAPIVLPGTRQMVHLFASHRGFYLFDGAAVQEISFAIEDFFTDSTHTHYINPSLMDKIVIASSRDRAWISYGTSVANDRTIRVDFQDQGQIKFTGPDLLGTGAYVGYSTLRTEIKNGRVIAGTTDGKMYDLTVNGSDETLQWAPKTTRIPLSSAIVQDTIKRVTVDADLGSAATIITVTSDTGKSAGFSADSPTTGRKLYSQWLPLDFTGRSFDVQLSSASTAKRHWYAVGLESVSAERV